MTAALSVERVSVRYGERNALADVSARFSRGRVAGIVGPNGAGKTTLLRAALGLVPLASGAVTVLDRNLAQWSRESLARATAYLPQGGGAQWPVSARHIVSLGRMPHRPPFARLSSADEAAIDEALERADAAAFAQRNMNALSAGERARVLFARALATKAQVLFADEPAAYLDPAHQLRLMELLREEAGRGTAVAVTLHDLSLASRFCDDIIVLDRGGVAASGEPGVALTDTVLKETFGVAAIRAAGPSGAPSLVVWNRI
jgi:iron complex transport system ATP-binding protein